MVSCVEPKLIAQSFCSLVFASQKEEKEVVHVVVVLQLDKIQY
jgi:hypothetical protein